MTYEEVFDLLHSVMPVLQMDLEQDAIDVILDALEKQIPNKVNNKDLLGTFRDNRIYYGECPACGKAITSYSCMKWCDQCGQSVEWSD